MYDVICSWENLRLAYDKAARGKRGRSAAAAFEVRLADNLLQLQDELLSKTYTPGPYTSFYIHDPKKRLISAAPFRDRVVHHALCNVIEPIFERSFIFDSYANRSGKGTHRALDRAQYFARRYHYVLQCDVEQFFPAVDHAALRRILARQIDDADTLGLIDQILISGVGVLAEEYQMRYFPRDSLLATQRPRGLPIGNLTSQFWANCYLNPFDHFVQRELRCSAYVRYVDDMVIFGDDKAQLWEWREALERRLARLRLTIHPGAQPRPVTEGFPFLGFVIYPAHRRLKQRKVAAYWRALRGLLAQGASPAKVEASLLGWINHARYGDTWGLRRAVIAALPSIHGGHFVERTADDLHAHV
jgi:RNA-directed DNA polymerase